jgi:DNA-binding NarL/FixJ family response regulator
MSFMLTMMPITVLLADDHLLFAECIMRFLQKHCTVLGIARDGRAMVEMAHQYKPDVIVADISLPQLNGIDAARLIQKESRSSKILFLTMHADLALAEEAFAVGARGFITKTTGTEELLRAIQAVSRGETYITHLLAGELISILTTSGPQNMVRGQALTLRQRQTLQLLAEGKTMKEAAAIMKISTRTAECHKYEIMRKVGGTTTADLIRYAVRIKLV